MTRIAVLGANGQVGAEVCLLLRNQPDVELIPICRNQRSSSYLRYHGITCRHGLPADTEQAGELLAGADVILDFALALGLPRDTRRINEAMIRNSFRCAPAGAVNVYFSSMAVYGFPALAGIRRKTAYSKEKLFCERVVRRESRRSGKAGHIFRLGHVLGQLQGGTQNIRSQIAAGPLQLPRNGEFASNSVYTVSIVEAVLRVAEGKVAPDTYDLTSHPGWSWRRVYEYEAEQMGARLDLVEAGASGEAEAARRRLADPIRLAGRVALAAARRFPALQEAGRVALARLPGQLNSRISAMHNQGRARREIQELIGSRVQAVTLPDPWTVRNALDGLTSPADLRKEDRFRLAEAAPGFDAERRP